MKVLENMVLRGIFGCRRDEVKGEWTKIHSEELNDLNCSSHIVRVIKSRRLRWAGHVAHIGKGEEYTGFWRGNRRERDLINPGVYGDNIKMDLQTVGCGGLDRT